MDIKEAAINTKALMKMKDWPEQQFMADADSPDSFLHIQWMLDGIILGYIQHEKAHRWLGWAQAAICIHQEIELSELKKVNHLS